MMRVSKKHLKRVNSIFSPRSPNFFSFFDTPPKEEKEEKKNSNEKKNGQT